MLTQGQVIVHILYALVATTCIVVFSQPRNSYVTVRIAVAIYLMVVTTNFAQAYYDTKRTLFIAFGVFFMLNQWGTWALIHQYNNNTTVVAAYLKWVTIGWIVASALAKVILPVVEK
jgi:hypothetical protein